MAAIVRFTRLRSRLLPLRSFVSNSLGREFSHVTGFRNGSSLPRLYSVAKTEDVVLRRPYTGTSLASPITEANEKLKKSAEIRPRSSGSELTDLLRQLDDQVRRWGRVDREHVQNLLDLVSKNGSVSTQQSIMVLRCTGSLLVKESSSERNAMFEKAMNVLQSVGAEVNVQIYNAMLRAKLENKQPFSPVEVLSEMENDKNLLPNRVTYQLLLSQFCEKGDIEGASTILEHMKSQNLPVNENIFNALVKGHVAKGDIAGAKAVLTTMSDSGMDPTAETYKTLLCGLAKKGDLAGIKQSLEEAEKASVKFFARHLYEVVVSLAVSGHNESIDEVLNYIQQKIPRHNQDALNCMFQLVAEGYDDIALRVFNTLDHSSYQSHQGQHPGSVLMRVMIIKGRPIEKVLEIQNKLQSDNKLSGGLEEIANMALRYQHSGYVLKIFEQMEKEGYAVKQHYFWPVFKYAADCRDVKGAMDTVACLVKCTREKDDLVAGSVFRWAVKPLLQKGESLETLVNGVRNAGMPETEVEMIKIAGLLSAGNLEEAAKLINGGTRFSPGILKSELVHSFFKSKFRTPELIKVIQAAQNQLLSPFVDAQSGILLGILKTPSLLQDTAIGLINEWINADLKLFKNFEKPIKQEMQRLGISSELVQKVDQLFVDQVQEQIPIEDLKKASIEEMEKWMEKSKGFRMANLERTLLSKYCLSGMVEKADSLKRSLDERGFIYGPDLLRMLGTLAAKDKKNLEEALTYKQQLETNHPSFGAYAVLVLHIAKLQLKAKKFEDALSSLQNFSEHHSDGLKKSGATDGYVHSDLCRNILIACSEEFEPSKVQQLYDALCQNGFVKEGTFSLINQIMNAYIKKGDAEEILLGFETFITRLNKAPQFSEVFKFLIEKEDAARLQKAVDLVTTVSGEMSTLLYLVASFIESNKPRQARKILETPGLRAVMKPLVEGCERFLMSDKEKELEQLVEYTKVLQGIDRDEMLLQLMRLYAKRKDVKKLMEVFSLFEEERIRPRPRTLRYLAKVLESLGQPVPFEVPTTEQSFDESLQPTPSTMETEVLDALKANDITKVTSIKEKMDAKGEEFSSKFVISMAKFLLTRKDNQMFRKFAHLLAESGDTASLLAIRKLTLSKSLDHFVHQRLFLAYLHKNKVEELIDYLRENPDHLSKYLTMNGINLLHQKRSDLMPSLVSIIEAHYEKSGKIHAAGLLYNFYMLNSKSEELDKLLKKYPLKNRVRLSYVCQMARRLQKEEILQKVLEIHPSESPRRLIVPFNQMLLLKCDQGDWASGLEHYKSALKSGLTFDDFWVRSLQTLGSLLEGNGQPLPWQPGMLEKRAASESSSRKQNASSSSSSDDSSSDSDGEGFQKNPKSQSKV